MMSRTYTVYAQKEQSVVSGPYSVVVIRRDDDKGTALERELGVIVSARTGILSASRCNDVAYEYARNFGATIATPDLI